MDISILLQYSWALLVLIGLEGILAADNAVVLAVMVKHLPDKQQKKALFYGLVGAFFMRFGSLFMISLLVDIWQVQAIGAAYLLYIAINHLIKVRKTNGANDKVTLNPGSKGNGFWATVIKVEIADLAFAIDSMLAAVAIAITLPEWGSFTIGNINGGQFLVMFLGGFLGLVIMRFAATWFVKLLKKYPALESAAFMIVGWVGIKLVVTTLAHKQLGVLPESFPESPLWKFVFWGVLLALAAGGFLHSRKKAARQDNKIYITERIKKAN